jgi:hypothetical protein
MRKIVVLTLAAAIGALLATSVALAQRPPSQVQVERSPAVRILRVHPNPNTGCISLELRIRGWRMYPGQIGDPVNQPGGGHYHIYVNGKYYTFSANAATARACGLAGGATYRLQVILAYNNHQEIAARSQVVTAVLR